MHCVQETDPFARSASRIGLSEDDRLSITTMLARNPYLGVVIPGTGGARKFRFPRPGKGKRAGYRVVTYYAGDDVPVFLLDIFEKGERVDLSKRERNQLKEVLGGIADDYRQSVRNKLARIA